MAIERSTNLSPRPIPPPVAAPEPQASPPSAQPEVQANTPARTTDTFETQSPKTAATQSTSAPASSAEKPLPPIESNKNTVQAGTVPLTDEQKKARGAQKIETGPGVDTKKYDGQYVGSDGYAYPPDKFDVSEVPPFRPEKPVSTPPPTTYYVNGIDTRIQGEEHAAGEAQKVANETGTNVVLVYNATEGFQDVLQTAGDRVGAPGNKATDTLSNAIYNDLKAGKQVNVVGYSQGGAVVAHALRQVDDRIANDNGGFFGNLPVVGRDNQRKREELLGNVNVTSIAGAGKSFPSGPKYTFYVNKQDPVPSLLGTHDPNLASAAIDLILSGSPVLSFLNGGSSFQRPPNSRVHTFDTGNTIPSPLGVDGKHGINTYLNRIQDTPR